MAETADRPSASLRAFFDASTTMIRTSAECELSWRDKDHTHRSSSCGRSAVVTPIAEIGGALSVTTTGATIVPSDRSELRLPRHDVTRRHGDRVLRCPVVDRARENLFEMDAWFVPDEVLNLADI